MSELAAKVVEICNKKILRVLWTQYEQKHMCVKAPDETAEQGVKE